MDGNGDNPGVAKDCNSSFAAPGGNTRKGKGKPLAQAKHSSTVSRIAAQIRLDAVQLADGKLLGSEDDLVARYKVSRPTLRQAASLVVQEQLLMVRRGSGGGYFARAPEAHAVSRMAALYLHYHDAHTAEILAAFMPLRVELVRLAVANDDPQVRAELEQFLADDEKIAKYSFRDFVVRERKFNLLVAELSENKALGLFMEILLDLAAMGSRRNDMYRNRPRRVASLRRERNALGHAILDRDEELAVAIARRCSRMSYEWHQEDLARGRSEDSIVLRDQTAA